MSADRHVVLILRHFTVGGLERVVLSQVRLLLDSGFGVTVVVVHPGRDNALIGELDERARLRVLPSSRLARIAALRSVSRDRVVLVQFGDGKLFASLRPGLTAARSVVRFCHSDYAHLRGRAKNAADRLLSATEDRIVAVGGRSTRFLLDDVGVPAGKVITLPNALPLDPPGETRQAARERWLSHDRQLLVSVASFYPHKGHQMLLRGFAGILREQPETELALVGDGSETLGLWQLARELGVLSRVRWLGALWNRGLVGSLLNAADVFVSMSRFEGIPISVLEARQHGLPMVLSDIQGHRDGAGSDAVYVPVDDHAAFARATTEQLLMAAKSGPEDRRTAGNAAGWDRYARDFIAIIRQAQGASPVPAGRSPVPAGREGT